VWKKIQKSIPDILLSIKKYNGIRGRDSFTATCSYANEYGEVMEDFVFVKYTCNKFMIFENKTIHETSNIKEANEILIKLNLYNIKR